MGRFLISLAIQTRITAIIAAFVIVCPEISKAIELQGRLMSDVYVFEENGERHWRPYLSEISRAILWRGTASQTLPPLPTSVDEETYLF